MQSIENGVHKMPQMFMNNGKLVTQIQLHNVGMIQKIDYISNIVKPPTTKKTIQTKPILFNSNKNVLDCIGIH